MLLELIRMNRWQSMCTHSNVVRFCDKTTLLNVVEDQHQLWKYPCCNFVMKYHPGLTSGCSPISCLETSGNGINLNWDGGLRNRLGYWYSQCQLLVEIFALEWQLLTITKADSRFAPSQWEVVSLCNDVSHWLGTNLESALITHVTAIGCSDVRPQ